MANAVWPPGLPQSQQLGTELSVMGSPSIRTETDGGPAFARPRYTSAPRRMSFPLTLTNAQRQIFDSFYETTINMGADAFDWEDPVTDAIVEMRFLETPGFSMTSGAQGRIWTGVLQLELLP